MCCLQLASSRLVSADYEGSITLWDLGDGEGRNIGELDAHERRIWSAAFCPTRSSQFVSGSDDGLVKVSMLQHH